MRYTGDLLNLGCSHIYNFVQKKAAEKVLQDEVITKEIERRSAIDINGNKKFSFDSNSSLMKIVNKLPTSLKPNIKGLTKEQLSIYDNYPKIYGESISMDNGPIINANTIINSSNTILNITCLLKDVLDKPNTIKSIKNYELCMQNIQNLMHNNYYNNSNSNNNEFEEGSEELKLCEKTIKENKLKELNLPENEESKLISQISLSSFRNAYIAFEQQHKKLLNTYVTFIKGWFKSTTS